MSQQQTVLRVARYQNVFPDLDVFRSADYEFLDLYSDIPIKINKSIAEIEDISKRNSDYSIGLSLPGSKTNNRFFESYFNVDSASLYFNATLSVQCNVLIDEGVVFTGYLRLNKVSVLNSKVEYDVTLYSTIGDLFGQMGNKLLIDLDFNDTEYTFNHIFDQDEVGNLWAKSNFFTDSEYPFPYFYPILHNGYNYQSVSGATFPNVSGNTSGATVQDQTRLYTTTSPISGFTGTTQAYAAGVEEYYINSPTFGLRINQLKPALNIWSLIRLIFKTYGYEISGDFFNTPWMKGLYLYGYFSSELTKFSYKLNNIEELPLEGVELIYSGSVSPSTPLNIIVCKRGTGIPCYCLSNINYRFANTFPYTETGIIEAGTSGVTINAVEGFDFGIPTDGVPVADISTLRYFPVAVGTSLNFQDGDFIDFSLVIDQNIKQIDLLSSIAKKFNLVFIPDPDAPNKIIIEAFDYFMGTGQIYDWTPKLSYDKGFTVEPALNYLDSNLIFTDQEDGDEGNRIFKIQNNRIYGQNNVYNPTNFKSTTGKTDTIFSPELIRKWDDNIGLPLGLNYSASSEQSTFDNQVRWLYKGIKTKPKIFFWLMGLNPFIDSVGEVLPLDFGGVETYRIKTSPSSGESPRNAYAIVPAISHTMPMGLADSDKINNDTLCILFNSEYPTDIGVQTYNTYTENDVYNKFYSNRITNIYDPNTRFINGYFDLKYSDVLNLKWNDVIKIQEQYFIVNKLSEFNLTNREMTKVELIQFNVNPQEYPTRYFKYTYCDNGACFKVKTDFTNPNLRETNFLWSIWYDNQVGSLTGQTSGFTSAFRYFTIEDFQENYVPYTMNEITEDEYNTTGCDDFSCDTLIDYLYSELSGEVYLFGSFWNNSGYTNTGVNVWNNCTDFTSTKNTYGINLGSSTRFGPNSCVPTPTPTLTPTPTATGAPTFTPTPTPTPIPYQLGGLIVVNSKDSGPSVYFKNSTNTGTTWNNPTLPNVNNVFTGRTAFVYLTGNQIAMSDDGTHQYAVRGFEQYVDFDPPGSPVVYTISIPALYSSNSGAAFVNMTTTTIYPEEDAKGGYQKIYCSRNGQYFLAFSYCQTEVTNVETKCVRGTYGSVTEIITLSGNTSVAACNSPFNPYGGALSLTGQYQVMIGPYTNFDGSSWGIAKSSDYGENWTFATGVTNNGGSNLVMSDNGQYLYNSFNGICKSSNYGSTWSNVFSGTTDNIRLAMSSTGDYVYGVNTGVTSNQLIKSSDNGTTFSASTIVSGTTFLNIACTANGQIIMVLTNSNDIYQSINYGVSWSLISSDVTSQMSSIVINRTIPIPPTPTPTPTAAPTATPTGTPTVTPTPIPGSIPTGSLFYYDPGNISSYPGSGSVLYDLSGNGRNANINTGITWTSGSAAYFNLNGNDNNSITGTTLSQTYTSWSMWMGIYRNDTGSVNGYDGFMFERTAANNCNGLGTFQNTDRLDLNVNDGTEKIQPFPGTMTSGSWMFVAGAVDNTTYTTQVYKTGDLSSFVTGSKAAGSSNFNNAIVLGEDKEASQDRTMNGRIGPALMYDRKLSTTELTQINNFFNTRYGI
jgi:hypothetical protein